MNRSMVVRARIKSGADWSELTAAAFTADQDFSRLLFTEVMYHPRAFIHTPRDEEFIELRNLGDVPLDVSGLRLVGLTQGTTSQPLELFKFPAGSSVPPGARVDGVMLHLFNNHLGRPALVATEIV